MNRSLRLVLFFAVGFMLMMLFFNLSTKNECKKYIYNNLNKLEYVSSDVIYIDTFHNYKIVDTLNTYNYYELKLKDNKCYIVSYMEKNIINLLIDNDLKYSFNIHNNKDSTIFKNLYRLKNVKYITYQSTN